MARTRADLFPIKNSTRRAVQNPECILGYWPDKDPECAECACENCGWNCGVAHARAELIHTEGLKKDVHGLFRLALHAHTTEAPVEAQVVNA